MPLSTAQKGAIGQFAFLLTALTTGGGEVEIYSPAADNEGRDAEVRRHLKPTAAIGVQIKVAFLTVLSGGTARYLGIRFVTAANPLQDDARFWYFFAYYDPSQLRFQDPVFLIPAHVFHTMGRMATRKGKVYFLFLASLSPDSRDRWRPYRVPAADLGARLLEIIDKAPPLALSKQSRKIPHDSLWLGRAVHRGSRRLRAAATKSTYDLVRDAVLERDSVSAWYQGHFRIFSPGLLGTKADVAHVLGYQFDGTSHEPLRREGSPENWRCLRVDELTDVKVLPGIWQIARKGKGFQNCIDKVDVSAYRPAARRRQLLRAA
jgi:hypothetical protein